jgi:phytoene dehydrogenase-like protein
LVAACYLARAGRDVVVLEALDRPGGGSRTEETVPGHRFDLHSVAHNIINMTDIPAELDLPGAGLVYQEMDPFSIALHADGRRVRFFRSVEATLDGLAETDAAEARAYQRFVEMAVPIVRAVLPAVRGETYSHHLGANLANLVALLREARQERLGLVRDVLGPYEPLLRRRLHSDIVRGPVAAFAAHASVGPLTPGGALFAFWQAVYHLFGQWHARGGAQGLTDALCRRLASLGAELRCSAPVDRIEAPGGRVRAVITEGGERIPAGAVVSAIDPKTALLDLLDPPLFGAAGDELAATRRGNVVQALVHVATDRLPPYPGGRPGDWNGLQSYVDHLGDLASAWVAAEAGLLPDPLPLYAFTPSALDPTLAPPGHHTVYLACPAAPSRVDGGWEARREEFTEAALDTLEARAPGFRSSILGLASRTPLDMEQEERWPGGHPMHLDIVIDQLGALRPVPRLASHRTPVEGLYVSGAGTSPTGGIAGTPGRQAARALLSDARRRRNK